MNLPFTLAEIIPLVTLVGGLLVAFATAVATYSSVTKRANLREKHLNRETSVELADEDRKLLSELTTILTKLVEEIHDHRREIYDLAGEIRRKNKP